MNTAALILLTLFTIKHFFCDFHPRIQTAWMYKNKGTYGHLGGIAHASIHVYASFALLTFGSLGVELVVYKGSHLGLLAGLLLFEGLVHYHMDWFKMWWCERKGYRCDLSDKFWFWFGIDQMVHYLTYIIMVLAWT